MLLDQSSDDSVDWAVTYVSGGKELDFQKKAEGKGLDVYCPLGKRKIKLRNKHKMLDDYIPAFPNYVFVKWPGLDRYGSFATIPSFRYVLPVLIPDDAISLIKEMQDDGAFDVHAPDTVQFYAGERVRIQSGPFVGFNGRINQSTRGKEIALVDINNKVVKINVSIIRKIR